MIHGSFKLVVMGGIVLGVLLIFFREMIHRKVLSKLPSARAYKLIFAGAVFCWCIAFAGMVAWTWSHAHRIDLAVARIMQALGRSPSRVQMPPPEPAAIPPALAKARSEGAVGGTTAPREIPQARQADPSRPWEPPPAPSAPAPRAAVVGNLPIAWPAVSGAVRYQIYDLAGGHDWTCLELMSPVMDTAQTNARVQDHAGSDFRCVAVGAEGQKLAFLWISTNR